MIVALWAVCFKRQQILCVAIKPIGAIFSYDNDTLYFFLIKFCTKFHNVPYEFVFSVYVLLRLCVCAVVSFLSCFCSLQVNITKCVFKIYFFFFSIQFYVLFKIISLIKLQINLLVRLW